VNRKRIVASVLARAKKYRNLTRMIDDPETAQRILELTEELKLRALALARPDEDRIRMRAREVWEENGRPFASNSRIRKSASFPRVNRPISASLGR
jgi:hypothetical protein